MTSIRLPAEWEPQDAVQLTWPHAHSDWRHLLPEIERVYENLVALLCRAGEVVIGAPAERIEGLRDGFAASGLPLERIHCYPVLSNDTWTRDHGPITVMTGNGPQLLDFQFNGWGGKYASELDNALTAALYRQGAYPGAALAPQTLVLEGGAIESDGRGTLLTTEPCLLNPNRNPQLEKAAIEQVLRETLGVRKINWLSQGALEGDDTDSHVDTLARLCPDNTLLYQACDDPVDPHFGPLAAMAGELGALTDVDGRPYRLLPLPWPGAKVDPEDGHRLPATYANFLIFNNLVLVPTYRDQNDDKALEQVRAAFPGYRVEGLDCLPVIRQHGSLHCITMQLPRGVLAGNSTGEGARA